MVVMKATTLVSRLGELLSEPTVYHSGVNWSQWSDNKWQVDCSLSVKIIGWGGRFIPANRCKPRAGCIYGSNGVKDSTTDGMINECSNISINFTSIPVGALLYMSGHVGVYIGNREVIETTAGWSSMGGYKTLISKIRSQGQRIFNGVQSGSWLKHGRLPWIDYSSAPAPTPIPQLSGNIEIGSIVTINKGARSYEGVIIASFVFDNKYRVHELKGDRAVLDKAGIHTAFRTSDLTLFESSSKSTKELEIGDRVKILRTGAGDSYGGSGTSFGIGWDDKYITAVYKDRLNPYQVGNKGKTDGANTVGFYKSEALQKL